MLRQLINSFYLLSFFFILLCSNFIVPTAFSFNSYIENSRYLDIVTASCKQIHKGEIRELFKKFSLGYYEKKNVALDQQGVKGRGKFSKFDFKKNST